MQALSGSCKELLSEQTNRHDGTIDACWIKAFHTNNRCTGAAGYLLCLRKVNRKNMILYFLLDAVDPNIKRQMVEKSKTNSKVAFLAIKTAIQGREWPFDNRFSTQIFRFRFRFNHIILDVCSGYLCLKI